MSRAAVKASQERRRAAARAAAEAAANEAFFAKLQLDDQCDMLLVACEGCGTEQMSSSSTPPTCIVCGCQFARFVDDLQIRYSDVALARSTLRRVPPIRRKEIA